MRSGPIRSPLRDETGPYDYIEWQILGERRVGHVRARRFLTAAALGATATALAVLGTASRAPAADTPSTQVKILAASIGGHSLFGTSTERPVPLEPRGDIPLSITMRKTGDTPVAIRYIRITGAMLGIRFVRFEEEACEKDRFSLCACFSCRGFTSRRPRATSPVE